MKKLLTYFGIVKKKKPLNKHQVLLALSQKTRQENKIKPHQILVMKDGEYTIKTFL